MVVLDTDHLSLLMWQSGKEGRRILARLDELDEGKLTTTIITYEAQMRGWLAFSSKARSISLMIESYGRLKRHLDAFHRLEVLEFDQDAASTFSRLKGSRIRLAAMDLKIASIVHLPRRPLTLPQPGGLPQGPRHPGRGLERLNAWASASRSLVAPVW